MHVTQGKVGSTGVRFQQVNTFVRYILYSTHLHTALSRAVTVRYCFTHCTFYMYFTVAHLIIGTYSLREYISRRVSR